MTCGHEVFEKVEIRGFDSIVETKISALNTYLFLLIGIFWNWITCEKKDNRVNGTFLFFLFKMLKKNFFWNSFLHLMFNFMKFNYMFSSFPWIICFPDRFCRSVLRQMSKKEQHFFPYTHRWKMYSNIRKWLRRFCKQNYFSFAELFYFIF